MSIDIEAVIAQYVETMLWSESCNGTAGGDHEHTTTDPQDCDASLEYIGYESTDLALVAMKAVRADVQDFCEANAADLADLSPSDIGHNFLLSRNRHGTGFWDRGWGERGDRLHAAATIYGSMGAYVGDDDQVYVQG
jgi:hypothetical protein